jgi:hypothetical protein
LYINILSIEIRLIISQKEEYWKDVSKDVFKNYTALNENTNLPQKYTKFDMNTWFSTFIYTVNTQRVIGEDPQKCSWLRHYATSPKVAGSIPNEVNVFFN